MGTTCFSDNGRNAEEEVRSKNNDNGSNHEDQDDFASVASELSPKDAKKYARKVCPNRGHSVSNVSYTICILYVNYTHGKFCDYFAATRKRQSAPKKKSKKTQSKECPKET